ncbi:MAG: Asp-tRNA(Asn)/Glu-tRNA(Gln) amidotransferase subunit GatB [Atribacterota bacterium]|jgi:aspartyl-tRNA(Asn)/glutamyl-tRNA(Gln) amidotransferase subunit B|nr:Asp-tRNA(Asn)/Glu-tRNA(Gln) amidotransferase subunit GatB [Atribacterota bacterium]MDY0382518.1 Asp-tRNA(Asn)/Glu-tRNA(Gln) amidotransferase subunit GatB [Atribacterota bacterium]
MGNDTVIGLEIHVQLLTKTKIFCNCSTDYFDQEPNSHTCPVCLGLPGSLPVLNKKAVDFAILTALALNCHINESNIFHRKNYFYPDLPKAYQISQFDRPLAENGFLEIRTEKSAESRNIRINRAHMEEDAGKLIHLERDGKTSSSLVDYNRSGIPLLEIVTEPDIQSSEEAIVFLQTLRSIVQYLGVCDGNLERGSMRCDANISIRNKENGELGTKTELKNMNSFRAIRQALDFEITRQRRLIEQGGKVLQETRRWDESSGKTVFMRSKEEALDYRYFPEPDLLPLFISQSWIESIENNIPELPDERKERFMKDYKLPHYDANRLVEVKPLGDYFERAAKNYNNYKQLANWILGELLCYLGQENIDIDKSPITPVALIELLELIDRGVISGKIAKNIFEEMFKTGQSAALLVEKSGSTQISNKEEIDDIIEKVVRDNCETVQDYISGKEKAIHFLVGQVMRYTKGRAQPDMVLSLLRERIDKT